MPYAPFMTEVSVTLRGAQFFGEQFHTVQTDSFVCAEGEATGSAREVPRHSHASSHFVLVVRGTAAARIRMQMFEECGPLLPELVEGCCLDLAGTTSGPFETETQHVPSWLLEARQIMRDCCATGITVRAVANCLGIHSVHLARAFRRYFHISPSEYVSRCRISRARELLVSSRQGLAEIAIEVGFSDQSHLTNAFRRETAMTPAAYRRLHSS
jgi:AraC-like DNA-binding protein